MALPRGADNGLTTRVSLPFETIEDSRLTITLYGIPNCDTVKKARDWLTAQGIAYAFHDYKKQGADPVRIAAWVAEAGLDRVLNRAGTTFKKLPEAERADLDAARGVAIMAANPSCIKRPIVEHPGGLLVGFKAPEWAAVFG
jgi:Spx/MgsR family transcriptional regulator